MRTLQELFKKVPDATLDSWNTVFLAHSRKFVFFGAVLFLCLTILLGWLSMREVKEVVTNDFNRQQLALAQHAADQISHRLSMLKREMMLLSLSPSLQYFEKASLSRRMGITYATLKEEAVTEIRFVEAPDDVMHLIDAQDYRKEKDGEENTFYLAWARDQQNRGTVLISDVYASSDPADSRHLLMKMATPVWQISADEAHPSPTNRFSGVLIIVVDATRLISHFVEGISSGKTGYAWVINSAGTFLYHEENAFIGKNAFEARQEKMPKISYARINEIQKKMMLAGKEGMSWYVSGWHRGQEGTIKKLIAFAPIHLDPVSQQRIWSVAVVAPVSEVEGAIHGIQVRQFSLFGVIILIVVFGALTIIFLEARWSSSLKREVNRQTEESRRSEQRYRSLVEHAEDLIFTLSPDGVFLSINAYGARFLKRGAAEIVGRGIAEIFHPQTTEGITATIRDVVAMKRGAQVTQLMRFDNQERWMNTNYRRLLNEDGSVYAILGIGRDITDRKKMEEQNYNTEKMASLGTLAAGVAHEINNPLAIILGYTDLLKDETPREQEAYDILSTIERQGFKAKRVVENLLTFSRKRDAVHGEVDVNRCIQEVLSILGNNILLNRVSLGEVSLSPTLLKVTGDPDELEQVFFNLVNNAIYAMKNTGGVLSVSTRDGDDGRSVEITISDTGPGIAREHRARIFDPLFTTKKVGEGTGLGLSVSYGIITRHRGIITFDTATAEESEHPGTTFYITLPAMEDAPTPQDSTRKAAATE